VHIVCLTLSAAIEVLLLLQDGNLHPNRAFCVTGPQVPLPPIHFIFSAAPPAELIEQVRAIPDVSIVAD
jgi:hypothetical protein